MKRRIQFKSKPETIPNYLEIHDKFGEDKVKELKHIVRKDVVHMEEDKRGVEEENSGNESDDEEDEEGEESDESDFEGSHGTPINDLMKLESYRSKDKKADKEK